MGPMTLEPPQAGSVAQPVVGLKPESVAGISSGVAFSKDTLRLKRQSRAEDSIEIRNGLPGTVRVEFDCPRLAGFSCTIDHSEIQAGATARFRAAYDPTKSGQVPGRSLYLIVQPFGRTKEIAILLE